MLTAHFERFISNVCNLLSETFGAAHLDTNIIALQQRCDFWIIKLLMA